jgi:hypothetical protein
LAGYLPFMALVVFALGPSGLDLNAVVPYVGVSYVALFAVAGLA